jgi:hypothetical protein
MTDRPTPDPLEAAISAYEETFKRLAGHRPVHCPDATRAAIVAYLRAEAERERSGATEISCSSEDAAEAVTFEFVRFADRLASLADEIEQGPA